MRWSLLFPLALALACNGKPAQKGEGGKARGADVALARTDVKDSVATVGGAPIPLDDLKRQIARTPPADGRVHSKEERLAALDELVEEEVLFQEALKRGLYHDSKVRKILTNLLLRDEVYGKVKADDIPEEDLLAYYQEHKDEFITPEKVQVRRIMLRSSDERDAAATMAEAKRIHAELQRDPRLFSELATKSSDGPYRRRGGDLGFVSREGKPGVDAAVIDKAFSMQINEISAPFEAGGAVHILQLVNRRERTERSFDQMKGSVMRMVKQRKHNELKEKYIRDARERYPVKIDEPKVLDADLARRPLRVTPGPDPDEEGIEDEPEPDEGHGHDH